MDAIITNLRLTPSVTKAQKSEVPLLAYLIYEWALILSLD